VDKKTFHWLFIIFSILFTLPVWVVDFLPFVDLPQHLNFVFILKNYHNPTLNYNRIYSLRLFPMPTTFHLFFNYALSFVFPLEISNKIYVTISILLFPLALWFLIKTLGGNEYSSLLGFLLSYNYNLFLGFMGINIGIAFVIFLIGFEIKYWRETSKTLYLLIIGILFLLLFLCSSLIYIFSAFTYLLIILFSARSGDFFRKGFYSLSVLIIISLFTFLPWQIGQFRNGGSELLEYLRQPISLATIYSSLWEFFRRLGITTDETIVFIFKIIFVVSLLTIIYLIQKIGIGLLFRDNYSFPTLLFSSSLLFYLFFPGMFNQKVAVQESFALLLFLSFLLFLSLALSNFRYRLFTYFLILILGVTWISILLRFILFDKETRPVKKMILNLAEGKKMVGLFYQKRPKVDLFGNDVFIHFPCYYAIYKKGFCGFSFTDFRFSPIVKTKPSSSPIDEIDTWDSIFPEGWEEFNYFLIAGEPRASDQVIIEKLRLIDRVGIWSLYEAPPTVK